MQAKEVWWTLAIKWMSQYLKSQVKTYGSVKSWMSRGKKWTKNGRAILCITRTLCRGRVKISSMHKSRSTCVMRWGIQLKSTLSALTHFKMRYKWCSLIGWLPSILRGNREIIFITKPWNLTRTNSATCMNLISRALGISRLKSIGHRTNYVETSGSSIIIKIRLSKNYRTLTCKYLCLMRKSRIWLTWLSLHLLIRNDRQRLVKFIPWLLKKASKFKKVSIRIKCGLQLSKSLTMGLIMGQQISWTSYQGRVSLQLQWEYLT